MPETTSSSSHQRSAIGSTPQPDPATMAAFHVLASDLSSFNLADLLNSEENTEADNPREIKEEKGTGGMSHYLHTAANMLETSLPRLIRVDNILGLAMLVKTLDHLDQDTLLSAGKYLLLYLAAFAATGFVTVGLVAHCRRSPATATNTAPIDGPTEDSSAALSRSTSIASSSSSSFFSGLPSVLTSNTGQIQGANNDIPQPAPHDTDPQQAEGMPDLEDDIDSQHAEGMPEFNSAEVSTQSAETPDPWDEDLDAVYGDDEEDAPQPSM